jgi:hypothetical protein
MILRKADLDSIARGEISVAFRRWRRPTVRAGGTLLTAAGQLQIGEVTVVEMGAITPKDARRAGYESKEALFVDLNRRTEGRIFRIELRGLTADPRVELRNASLDEHESATVRGRLARLDGASTDGPWTLRTLQVIRDHPGLRAGDLCRLVDQDRDRFKPNVRKLKNLGLTESLEVGYRLSPRGQAYLDYALSDPDV